MLCHLTAVVFQTEGGMSFRDSDEAVRQGGSVDLDPTTSRSLLLQFTPNNIPVKRKATSGSSVRTNRPQRIGVNFRARQPLSGYHPPLLRRNILRLCVVN